MGGLGVYPQEKILVPKWLILTDNDASLDTCINTHLMKGPACAMMEVRCDYYTSVYAAVPIWITYYVSVENKLF